MVKRLSFGFIACAAMVLCGCATLYNPATGKKEFILINSATEYAAGKSAIPELTKKYPLSKDPALIERLQRIGTRLAAASDRQDIRYEFSALEDKELNAMTIPGGFVFVNRGLMEAFSDDELAYVIAHEIGHVAARHIAKKMQANVGYQLILGLAFAAMSTKIDDQQAETLAMGAGAVYGLVDLSYSRKDEFEADRLGVKYARKAGFRPEAAFSALEKLKKGEGPNNKLLRYLRTHPYVNERIEALRVEIPRLNETMPAASTKGGFL